MDLKSRKDIQKKTLIQVLALIIFVSISATYSKILFVDKNNTNIEISQNAKTSVSESRWEGHSLAGSPAVSQGQIQTSSPFAKVIQKYANSGKFLPFCIVLTMLIGFYILLLSLKISPLSSIIGSLAFGLFCYGIAEIQAGEYLEMTAICLMPYLLTGIVCSFNDKKAIGAIITIISAALLAATCHYQILYYTLFIAACYIIGEFFAKEKSTANKLLSTATTVLLVAIAILTNSESIFQEYEYSRYATEQHPDYNIQSPYVNDGGEPLSLLIQNIKGGKSVAKLSENSETYNLLEPLFKSDNAKKCSEESPMYFGKKHFSKGTTYIGAIVVLLALFGSISSRKRTKWWAIAIAIIAIILSCGNIEYFISKNFPLFYNFSIFSNILIISALGISILAAIGLEELIDKDAEQNERKQTISLYVSTSIISVILLIFVIFPAIAGDCSIDIGNRAEEKYAEHLASYMPTDYEYAEAVAEFKQDYVNSIRSDRISLIRRDSAKSLLFVLLGATTMFLAQKKKINGWIFAATIAVLTVTDITIANSQKGNINTNNDAAKPNIAKTEILTDKSYFRVMDIRYEKAQSDSTTYLNFNSIGGKNGYCTQRYQIFRDTILNNDIRRTRYNILAWAQRDGMSRDEIQEIFSQKFKTPALDMMNVKYIILSDNAVPLTNTHALGNAWLADSIRWTNSETLELDLLKYIDIRKTAIIDEKYKTEFANIEFRIDSSDYIKLTSNSSDILKYESSCSGNRLAIFSENFYPKGWKAKIDGQKASFFRANHSLRAMIVPKGHHEIEFSYEPKSAKTGRIVATASNITLAIIIIISLIMQIITAYRHKKNRQDKEA